MKICSVIVGIQYYGVEVKSGSEVILVFDEENRYSEDTIVVKNENGDVVGNIIANLNHPSISDESIILNDIKNDKMIRKITTTNCKATIKRITKYVIFIVVDTENIIELTEKGDETMAKTELKDVNVVVECGEPQFAIGSDKIIGYDEIEICGNCGAPIEEHHKFCHQCGERVREEITSFQSSNNDENDGDEEMKVEIMNGTRVFDEIPFKENYNERISRFEQSDSQRENGECTIVTYYSNGVSFGTSRNFTMKITENNIEYIKSVIPHNQMRDEHIGELQEQLDDLVAQRGEFDPYWTELYKHQTDYTTFQTDDGKVYEVVGSGDDDLDFFHTIKRGRKIEYRGECPNRMHFWRANVL